MTGPIMSALAAIAVASGVNLYATVLVLGLSLRLGWVETLPAGLDVVSATPVLIVAGVLYCIEFLADKIPFVDNLWDGFHTFIRPAGGFILGMEMLQSAPPETQMMASLVAGGVSLTSHSGKASMRAMLNLASPAENVSNIGLSIAEDVGVAFLVLLAIKYPYVAGAIAAVIIILIIIFAPRIWRWLRFTLRGIWARLRSVGARRETSDQLPAAQLALLPAGTRGISGECTAQGLRGAHGRRGYLTQSGGDLFFTYQRWGRPRLWQIPRQQIAALNLRQRVLADVVEVVYHDEKQRPQVARFLFLKDRAPLASQIAQPALR